MRTIRLNEIIPSKLYQRGQFMTFPWSAKMEMLEQYNIDMVINLWARPDPELHTKPGLVYLHWPIGGGEPPAEAEKFLDFIYQYMSDHTVLVHCEAGVNRSVWLVAKLYERFHKVTGKSALEMVNKRINHTKIRRGLLADLGVFE